MSMTTPRVDTNRYLHHKYLLRNYLFTLLSHSETLKNETKSNLILG